MSCQRFMTAALAALVLASTASAHMIMLTPAPYSNDTIDSEPLGGGDFPCKKGNGFKVSEVTKMAVGDTQTLQFRAFESAVHGGGSCQMSVTLDKEPTENSVFKVVHSMEGACPGLGSTPKTFDYQLPAEIPNGEATIAWTWFSKLSGAPELYMNCGRIEVSGGADDTSGFDQLPNMLVANVPGAGCESPQNFDTKYPDPGQSVIVAQGAELKGPSGSGCGQVASAPPPPPPDNSSTTVAPVPTSSKTPPPPPQKPTSVQPPPSSFATVPIASSSAPPPASSAPAGGNSCSSGGLLCNGNDQFGLCDNGQVVWQDVAPGTQCVNGQILKRSLRFSRMQRLREMGI